MTPVEFATYVRLKTRTNSSTFTDADILVLLNHIKNEVCDRALEVDEDIFLLPTYLDLVADQREYPLYSALLSRIKRVEAKLDASDYIKLLPLDLTDINYAISSESQITANFTNSQDSAYYDIMRNALWLYSGTITAVSDGLRIWLNTRPSNVASMGLTTDMSIDPSTTTHGIPSALHRVVAKGVIIEYKEGKEKPIPLTEREQKWEFDLEKAIQTLKKADYGRETSGGEPTTDGSEF